MNSATAIAHPNIAFIKYWGNRDNALRIPANGSISMNLQGLETRTSVLFDTSVPADELSIDGKPAFGAALERVSHVLDLVRAQSGLSHFARVASASNFPAGAGMASSASAFAALALAASKAAGLDLGEVELSRLARRGSGSACRSVPGGFVEWKACSTDLDSYAYSLVPPDHWDLVDCIAIISSEHKAIGSTQGNTLAVTSPLQDGRVQDTPRRLDICRRAIFDRDFEALAEIVEVDSNLLHAVMMTSSPALFYWQPITLTVMEAVRQAHTGGLPICYTIDAGPNVHVITEKGYEASVKNLLEGIAGVKEICVAAPGGPARLVG
jgi:diphosphomevalonate decarboxylase